MRDDVDMDIHDHRLMCRVITAMPAEGWRARL